MFPFNSFTKSVSFLEGGVTCQSPYKVYSMITLLIGLVRMGVIVTTMGTILGSIIPIKMLFASVISLIFTATLENILKDVSKILMVSAIESRAMDMLLVRLSALKGSKVKLANSNFILFEDENDAKLTK